MVLVAIAVGGEAVVVDLAEVEVVLAVADLRGDGEYGYGSTN
jgi:hypothetical protein